MNLLLSVGYGKPKHAIPTADQATRFLSDSQSYLFHEVPRLKKKLTVLSGTHSFSERCNGPIEKPVIIFFL
jgi:hypothetical protein